MPVELWILTVYGVGCVVAAGVCCALFFHTSLDDDYGIADAAPFVVFLWPISLTALAGFALTVLMIRWTDSRKGGEHE
jgi:hypothetical protein